MAKRAEITAEIAALEDRLQQALGDREHLDACIRMFDPDADLSGPTSRRAGQPRTPVGETTRFILDRLRGSPVHMTTPDLARAMMTDRGLDLRDGKLRHLFRTRINTALQRLKKRGHVEAVMKPGALNLWAIVKRA